jgi:hypothetical protein
VPPPTFLWPPHFSGHCVSLATAFLRPQHFSGRYVSLATTFLWPLHFSGRHISPAATFLWPLHFSGPTFLWLTWAISLQFWSHYLSPAFSWCFGPGGIFVDCLGRRLPTSKLNSTLPSGFTSARLYTVIRQDTTNTPTAAIEAAINTDTTLLCNFLGVQPSQEQFPV